MTSRPDYDVAVIGGGMVGVATALEMVDRGLSVALIDPADPRGRASFGNAGVISRGSVLPMAGPAIWGKLARYLRNVDPALHVRYGALPSLLPWGIAFLKSCNEDSVRRTARALDTLCAHSWSEHLRRAEELGFANRYVRRGWLKLYRSEEAFAGSALERRMLAENGITTEILDGDEIAKAEPALKRRFARALQVPDTGSVDNPGAVVEAYTQAFVARGGHIIAGKVLALSDDGEQVSVQHEAGHLIARQAVVAAGARADQLLRPLGYRFPLAAERGYHRHFRVTGATLTRPIYDTGGSYILAPMGDTVRLTSGVELARPDDPPNYSQIETILPDARRSLEFGEPVEAEAWHGSRPSSPDGLPVIGRLPRHPNIIVAFGHGHIGLSTGPITGRVVADIAGQRQPPIPIAPFAPERYL